MSEHATTHAIYKLVQKQKTPVADFSVYVLSTKQKQQITFSCHTVRKKHLFKCVFSKTIVQLGTNVTEAHELRKSYEQNMV